MYKAFICSLLLASSMAQSMTLTSAIDKALTVAEVASSVAVVTAAVGYLGYYCYDAWYEKERQLTGFMVLLDQLYESRDDEHNPALFLEGSISAAHFYRCVHPKYHTQTLDLFIKEFDARYKNYLHCPAYETARKDRLNADLKLTYLGTKKLISEVYLS